MPKSARFGQSFQPRRVYMFRSPALKPPVLITYLVLQANLYGLVSLAWTYEKVEL